MRTRALLLTAILLSTTGVVHAASSGGPGGRWPKSWPKELEPLRQQAWTWVGAGVMMDVTMFDIPFATRESFEAAWPHILKLKPKGVPLTLVRGSYLYVEPQGVPGVRIMVKGNISDLHEDPSGIPTGPTPDAPPPAADVPLFPVTGLVLVVDGNVVDLNRIPLPPDTPIVDNRFSSPHRAP